MRPVEFINTQRKIHFLSSVDNVTVTLQIFVCLRDCTFSVFAILEQSQYRITKRETYLLFITAVVISSVITAKLSVMITGLDYSENKKCSPCLHCENRGEHLGEFDCVEGFHLLENSH